MIIINDTINFEEGVELLLQNQEFQTWFSENISDKIDFAQSCTIRDFWNRPSEWHFDNLIVKAVYFTENENYNFNKFLIYGTI